MPGDNFKVDVCSDGRDHFAIAIRLAFANAPGGKATHYVSPLPERAAMVLLWHEDSEAQTAVFQQQLYSPGHGEDEA